MKNLLLKPFLFAIFTLGIVFAIISCTSAESNKTSHIKLSEGNNELKDDDLISENPLLEEEIVPEVIIEKATDLTDLDFYNVINKGVTLVDFWAAWCAPCRIQGPIVDEVAKEMGTKANVTKLNVDHFNTISMSYDVRNIPTIIIFKDGKAIERFVGVQNKDFLIQKLNAHI